MNEGFEPLLRASAPGVLATVLRRFGGPFDAAEDAVQEAMLAAAMQWREHGVPDHPRAWLVRVATRRMLDLVRSETARKRREDLVAVHEADAGTRGDDMLTLLFMCCHPALTRASAIALTLRAVAGLTTAEIANAFFVPEATMAQRVSRAKQRIRSSGVPFAMPDQAAWPDRLAAVLHVLYLVFNEGYASSIGASLQRVELSNEAIRLTRAVQEALPGETEVLGLLALMLLTDARREARVDAQGDIVPLDEQDRTRWDGRSIAEGVRLAEQAMSSGSVGPYAVQAAIAALHDEAPRFEDTDWRQIVLLYRVLEGLEDNPMVTLNRAIALAMVEGPETGLALVDTLAGALAGHHRLDAVRGHLYERMGVHERAMACYRAAALRTTSIPEQRYLFRRAARLADGRV